MSNKREFAAADMAIVKRSRSGDDELAAVEPQSKAIVRSSEGAIIATSARRTSSLQAPTVMLTGHDGNVTSLAFAPGGAALASGSFDTHVFLWNTFGANVNYDVLKGHHKAVLAVKWAADGGNVFSASADGSARVWDSETSTCNRVVKSDNVVGDVALRSDRPDEFATASDDGTVRLWDLRDKDASGVIEFSYQVLSVALSTTNLVYCAGIGNDITVYDTRKTDASLFALTGHREAITGAVLSSDGSYLLTNSRDHTVRVWDAKPFSSRANRCLKIFAGATHNAENNLIRCDWSPDGAMVCAGSADRNVLVWDTTTKEVLYKLPGHKGVVNQVVFHPTQPIIASASADRCIYLGELQE